jgi:glycosyltransferase involved in cell wall biosynthesis
MRVVLDVSAVPARPVGAGAYIINVAGAVARTGRAELHLAARRSDAARWHALVPAAEVHAVAPNPRALRLAWEQIGAPRLARETGAAVWHGPHYTLPLRTRTPGVVTVHDTTFFDHPEWHERSKVAFFRPMLRAAIRRARAVIAVSQFTADRLRELLSPTAPIDVIRHGVDLERFTPGTIGDAGDLTALRTIGVHPPYIAFVATHEPRKNVPALVRAFARLAPDRPDLRLVIAGGTGWGGTAVRDAVAASGVATRILRPGYIDAAMVPALFRQAEAVAYPSFVEGFGLPALEALACGAALVTTSGSAMEEVVEDAALLVPPGDDGALADALAALLDDDGLRDELRAAGPPVAAPYTWERAARAHLDVYEGVGREATR